MAATLWRKPGTTQLAVRQTGLCVTSEERLRRMMKNPAENAAITPDRSPVTRFNRSDLQAGCGRGAILAAMTAENIAALYA